MARLSDQEKQDLLDMAGSVSMTEDFARLRQTNKTLTPMEYLEFLTWASELATESASNRDLPIEARMLI